MYQVSHADRERVVEILTASFADNLSVNDLIPQDARRMSRIMHVMRYSFEMCMRYGEVLLSEDRNACALVLYTGRRPNPVRKWLLDCNLIYHSIGIRNIRKASQREKCIMQKHNYPFACYLWFIGVLPAAQHTGLGTRMMKAIINKALLKKLPLLLETSTARNIHWYDALGFKHYDTLHLGYTLRFYCHP